MSSQQVSSNKTSILYKSRTIILELLAAQNYDITEHTNFSINDIHAMFINNQMDMLVSKKVGAASASAGAETAITPEKAYIKYYLDTKTIRPNILDNIIEDLFTTESEEETGAPLLTKRDTLVLILNDEPNDTIYTKIKFLYDAKGIYIAPISIQRLQFNILEHQLVPPHIVMTDEQIEEMKRKYNIRKLTQLPEISQFDSVAICIFLRPGQVCHIIRSSINSVLSDFYRVCV
jgi:DNA-directed RNA polymerase subunit H (RpoH/RPB5)